MAGVTVHINEAASIKLWSWYGDHQIKLCPSCGDGWLCAHTTAEVIECAIDSGIVTEQELFD